MTEAQLEKEVRRLLSRHGLYAYHCADNRRSAAGFPDWVIIGARVLWRELKTAYAMPTGEQRRVGYLLQASGQNWDIWRPLDWTTGRIARELAAISRRQS